MLIRCSTQVSIRHSSCRFQILPTQWRLVVHQGSSRSEFPPHPRYTRTSDVGACSQAPYQCDHVWTCGGLRCWDDIGHFTNFQQDHHALPVESPVCLAAVISRVELLMPRQSTSVRGAGRFVVPTHRAPIHTAAFPPQEGSEAGRSARMEIPRTMPPSHFVSIWRPLP